MNASKQYSVKEKLRLSLFKLLDMEYDVTDDTILSKLNSYLADPSEMDEILSGDECESFYRDWLIMCLAHWKNGDLKPTIRAFSIRVLSIICKNQEHFMRLKSCEKDILSEFLEVTSAKFAVNPLYPIAYSQLLSSFISHEFGLLFILENKLWVEVLNVYLSNESMYVKKACSDFLVNLCVKLCQKNLKEISQIIHKIFELYKTHRQIASGLFFSKSNRFSQILVLLVSILEAFLMQKDLESASRVLSTLPHFYDDLWADLTAPFPKEIQIIISKLLIIHKFIDLRSDSSKLFSDDCMILFCEDFLLKLAQKFLEKQLLREVIFLCEITIKYFQLCDISTSDLNLQENLLLVRLLPFLVVIESQTEVKNSSPILYFLSSFEQNNQSVWQGIESFVNNYRTSLISHPDLSQIAITSLITLQSNFEISSLKYGIFVLKMLSSLFHKYFIVEDFLLPSSYDFNGRLLEMFIATLIKLILDVAKISHHQKETYSCLPDLISFLSTASQSPKVSVKALKLVYLILNNVNSEVSHEFVEVVKNVAPDLLRVSLKHLYSISWDVRDSAIEVLTALSNLSCRKEIFSEPLVDVNIACDICSVFTIDSEYYVRASAIKCLCSLVTIPEIWSKLDQQDVLLKSTHALKTEDEAVVRREIPLLMKQIYEFCSISDDILHKLVYPTLGIVALKDLYWEVRVNCLDFWRSVIFKHLKTSEKIPSESENELKSFFIKQLIYLNNIGSLQVVKKCLADDYDLDVSKKSASILREMLDYMNKAFAFEVGQEKYFLNLLSKETMLQNVTFQSKNEYSSEACIPKNAAQGSFDCPESIELKAPSSLPVADTVIDSIVFEQDVKLLAEVYKGPENGNTTLANNNVFEGTNDTVLPTNELVDLLTKLSVTEYTDNRIKCGKKSQDNLESLLNDILLPGFNNAENPVLDCY